MLSFIMLTCHNADCHYAECRYADCNYAEGRGTKFPQQMKFQLVSIFSKTNRFQFSCQLTGFFALRTIHTSDFECDFAI
jgi:hypothetical protein